MQTNTTTQLNQTRPLFMFRLLSALAGGSQHLTLKALPTLLTDCVIVGHAEKADVVFTPPQWFAMCVHMMNENPQNFFLMPYIKNGEAKFAKAYNARADERINWSWDTITGKAKAPASVGFYPTNAQRKSRWAAMDFDVHDDDQMRARDLAHKAFAHLIREPHLYVALTTSAGDPVYSGWHLFIFTEQFFPCEEWTRLLKQVAAQIDAPIQPGICEIFPDECKGIGRGIRAPGTWNPKNGECGLILQETVSKLLPSELDKSSTSLSALCNSPRGKRSQLHSREKPALYRGEFGQWKNEFAITSPRSRCKRLQSLVGTIFFQVSKEVARENARLQYEEANPVPRSSLDQHFGDFEKLWAGKEREWLASLSPLERKKFDRLTNDNDREAFRIIRNWRQANSSFDFPVGSEYLAQRLAVTITTASRIRLRFCAAGILRQTAECVPYKLIARYEWIIDKP